MMWKSTVAGLLILLGTSAARAEETPPAALPLLEGPPAISLPMAGPGEVALAPVKVPPAFWARFLSYDAEEKLVLMGQKRRPLSREEVFAELGRPDLLEKSRVAERRRLIFALSGGGVLAVGVLTAVIARVGMPNLNKGFCVENYTNYNQVCVPDAQRREAISATGLVAGISLGGILGALAIGSSPNVLSKDEVEGLIANHNTTLMRRLRDGASRSTLTPLASGKGGGLALSFQF
ncbi:MAG: hypothetical protein ABI193_08680 [Minicystis sp.]